MGVGLGSWEFRRGQPSSESRRRARWSTLPGSGDSATVRALLAKKADVNAAAADGTTALHWAVQRDDVAMVEALLRAGAKVEAATRHGVTPLQLAATNGNAAVIDAAA